MVHSTKRDICDLFGAYHSHIKQIRLQFHNTDRIVVESLTTKELQGLALQEITGYDKIGFLIVGDDVV